MKKLFTAIQKNDLVIVKTLLDKSPELISCTLKGTPKKWEGQSPLQVALKSSSTEMIELLLEYQPDVNFIEEESSSNIWRAPVIHDAINRAIMYSRWNVNRPGGLEIENTKQEADSAYAILQKLILLGANVNGKDSYGNACIDRACLQARHILPIKNSTDRVLTSELHFDIARIFNLLISNGADMNYIAPNAFGKTYHEQYKNEPVKEFLHL